MVWPFFKNRKKLDRKIWQDLVPVLQTGGVGVLPTDTLYGLVGSALQQKTVERIYELRRRNLQKPMIILLASVEDLQLFKVAISARQEEALAKIWPGKVSVVLNCPSADLEYLHRGQNSLAFRVPQETWLRELLAETGPLVAPSANLEGEAPALNIFEAKKYFSEEVDFYLDAGELNSEPSTIVSFDEKDQLQILREGAVKLGA